MANGVKKLTGVLCAMVAMSSVTRAGDPQLTAIKMDIKRQVLMAAPTGNFAMLEKMAEGYRVSDERLSDGTSKAHEFYATPEMLFLYSEREREFEQWEKIFENWKAAYPNSSAATLMQASARLKYGWKIRGTSYAHKVNKEDFVSFGEVLRSTEALLLSNKATASADAEWYAIILAVKGGLGADKDELLNIAREGIARHPRSFQIYIAMMNYLMPQWGGSIKSMTGWANEIVALTKATEGDSVYARLYWHVEEFTPVEKFFVLADWPRLKSATDALLERYPSVSNIERSLKMACASRDPAEVNKRYAALSAVPGFSLEKTIIPEVYCRWPQPRTLPQ